MRDLRRRLPPEIAESARRFASGDLVPATPRAASTVALIRDGVHGIEVYLLRRVATMAFAARMHVFPGGSVDPRDADTAIGWAGPQPGEWAASLSADEPLARALVCAAVRETFEESGVLLAGPDPDTVVADTTGEDWEADREALIARTLAFSEFLDRRRLVLRADLLSPWAHWITPVVEPRRYDTRFFVAAVPPGQRPRDVGGESDRVIWLPITDALDEHAAGTLAMLPPTITTLTQLAEFADVAAVLAAHRTVEPWLPEVVLDDDGQAHLVLPTDRAEPR